MPRLQFNERMKYYVSVTRVKKSKISTLDFNNIPLGKTFTDHMFVCDYENGKWINPRIEPLQLVPMHPAAMSLHYGQSVIEGMKATLGEDGSPLLFRPNKNAERLNASAERLGMPTFPEDLFIDGVKKLTAVDRAWIPKSEGSSLYLRPFMYADEPFIGIRPANHYKFMIIATPAGQFFTDRIKLWAEEDYSRSAPGGTGNAKAVGNYAAAIKPTQDATLKGYDQVLWLDAVEHKYIQEAGTMNIFFKINDKIVTPNLNGTILNGITRDSVIKLLRAKGYLVEERPVKISEIRDAAKFGLVKEAFGTGTAVGIAMIEEIRYNGESIKFEQENKVGQMLFEDLNDIRTGAAEDPFDWVVDIAEETTKPEAKNLRSVFKLM